MSKGGCGYHKTEIVLHGGGQMDDMKEVQGCKKGDMKKKIEDRRNERREETREGRGAKMNRRGKTRGRRGKTPREKEENERRLNGHGGREGDFNNLQGRAKM